MNINDSNQYCLSLLGLISAVIFDKVLNSEIKPKLGIVIYYYFFLIPIPADVYHLNYKSYHS